MDITREGPCPSETQFFSPIGRSHVCRPVTCPFLVPALSSWPRPFIRASSSSSQTSLCSRTKQHGLDIRAIVSGRCSMALGAKVSWSWGMALGAIGSPDSFGASIAQRLVFCRQKAQGAHRHAQKLHLSCSKKVIEEVESAHEEDHRVVLMRLSCCGRK